MVFTQQTLEFVSVCTTVSANSPNPSCVYIRLCKQGKRFFFLLINGKVACICIGFHCVVSFASCYENDQGKITRERPTLILVPCRDVFTDWFTFRKRFKALFPAKMEARPTTMNPFKVYDMKKKTKLH